jgi:ATP-binding cassette subfamily B protein/subfamily B ATP-binding cassette protein MsbA
MKGQSLQAWDDQRLASAETDVQHRQAAVAELQATRARARGPHREQMRLQLARKQAELADAQRVLASTRRLHPWVYHYTPSRPFPTLVMIVVFLLVATLVKDLFLMGNVILVGRLAERATFDLRKLFYRRTLRMQLHAFGEDRTSAYLTHFTHDMPALSTGIAALFGRAILEPLKMTACLVGAALICWRLLLFSLVASPLAVLLMNWLSRSIRRANRRAMEEMSQVYGHLTESLNGIEAVKAYTMERHERQRFHQLSKQYMQKALRIVKYGALTRPCTEMIGIGAICLALLAGGYLVLNHQTHLFGIRMSYRPLTLPALMAFYALLAGVSDPARKFAQIYNQLQRGMAAADRIYDMLDREPTITDPLHPTPVPTPHRQLAFENVSFGYHANQLVLRDIDLHIAYRETVAIVGPNGCGKSTLTSLIPRFYDPVCGTVRLDGVDLRHFRLHELRQQIGMVSQQPWLFDDTIFNNIRYGSPWASEQDVIEAARKAHVHAFIQQELPKGYRTLVGQGGGLLSGGQRQRIVLARAILRDPEILILDEATSQIDLESERLIHRALVEFIRDRTAILITHRLSTLALADRILVMDAGRIVDSGTHQQLLGRCGLYHRLHHTGLQASA